MHPAPSSSRYPFGSNVGAQSGPGHPFEMAGQGRNYDSYRFREGNNATAYPQGGLGGTPNPPAYPSVYPAADPYQRQGSDLFECQWAVASGQRTLDEALTAIRNERRWLDDLEDALLFGARGDRPVRQYAEPPYDVPSYGQYGPPPSTSAGENAAYTTQLISQLMGTGSGTMAQQLPAPAASTGDASLVWGEASAPVDEGELDFGEYLRLDDLYTEDPPAIQDSTQFEPWFANAMPMIGDGSADVGSSLVNALEYPGGPLPPYDQPVVAAAPASTRNDTIAEQAPTPPDCNPAPLRETKNLPESAQMKLKGKKASNERRDYSNFIVPAASLITDDDFTYANHPSDKKIPRPPNNYSVWMKAWYKVNKGVGPISTSRVCSGMWNALTAEERKPWTKKAKLIAERHRKAFPGWKYRPTRTKMELMGHEGKHIAPVNKALGLRATTSLPSVAVATRSRSRSMHPVQLSHSFEDDPSLSKDAPTVAPAAGPSELERIPELFDTSWLPVESSK